MDQDHPTEGWLVKTEAEIKIQQDPAVMVQGWPSVPDTALSGCAMAFHPQQPAGTMLWAASPQKIFTKHLWELLYVGIVGGKILTDISKVPHSRAADSHPSR